MKLYYKAGACSLSPHIVLCEAGLAHELEAVDLGTKKTASGLDFRAVSPKGYVPALALDDGSVLTEGIAIVLHLAALAPDAKLAPAPGTPAYLRLIEWLAFISTELHKSLGMLFNPEMPDKGRELIKARLAQRFDWLAGQMGPTYLTGDDFSVADAYLFTVLNWPRHVGIDMSAWPIFAAYSARVAARPAVRAALVAEGLA